MPKLGEIFISLGDTTKLWITENGRLQLTKGEQLHDHQSIDLGPATKKRFTELRVYLERLKIHATEE
jgi:hypothetical protein